MRKFQAIEWFAFLLVIIGGINWALVGVFNFNLVSFLFGDMSLLSRIVYFSIGSASIFLIFSFPGNTKKIKSNEISDEEREKNFRI